LRVFVADEPMIIPDVAEHPLTAESCTSVEFGFLIDEESFDKDGFLGAVKGLGIDNGNSGFLIIEPERQDDTEYHAHLRWDFETKDEWDLDASFYVLKNKSQSDSGPYAETLMPWLGKFFKVESSNTIMQATFEYKTAERQSRYLLPLKVEIISGVETVIDGLSIDFVKRPNGMDKARLLLHPDSLNIWTLGTSNISFSNFNLRESIEKFSKIAMGLTEERKA
jgi:hypothetical protein